MFPRERRRDRSETLFRQPEWDSNLRRSRKRAPSPAKPWLQGTKVRYWCQDRPPPDLRL